MSLSSRHRLSKMMLRNDASVFPFSKEAMQSAGTWLGRAGHFHQGLYGAP